MDSRILFGITTWYFGEIVSTSVIARLSIDIAQNDRKKRSTNGAATQSIAGTERNPCNLCPGRPALCFLLPTPAVQLRLVLFLSAGSNCNPSPASILSGM